MLKKIIALTALFTAANASAGVTDYFRKYNVGVDYLSSHDSMTLLYDTPRLSGGGLAADCQPTGNPARMQCSTMMTGGVSSGLGLFLQQPFHRQGDFHFVIDLGFGLRLLNGDLQEEDAKKLEQRGLPLKQASFSLVGVVMKPYVQVGYTPSSSFPDILFSFGPAVQVSMGHITINDERENVVLATGSGLTGFMELEVVFWRFGEGFLSLYASRDFSGGDNDATDAYPHGKDGMDEFKASFSRSVGGSAYGFGLKLLTTFP